MFGSTAATKSPDAELQREPACGGGIRARQLYPGSNPLGVLPNVTFDVPNAANLALEGASRSLRGSTAWT